VEIVAEGISINEITGHEFNGGERGTLRVYFAADTPGFDGLFSIDGVETVVHDLHILEIKFIEKGSTLTSIVSELSDAVITGWQLFRKPKPYLLYGLIGLGVIMGVAVWRGRK
jgi:hypothetical protein